LIRRIAIESNSVVKIKRAAWTVKYVHQTRNWCQ